MLIKIKLATGEEHTYPFSMSSTVTVESNIQVEPSVWSRRAVAYSDVASIEIVEGGEDDGSAPEAVDQPMLTSPAVAIVHARSLGAADAAAHIEKAVAKFPGDQDLLDSQAELDNLIRTGSEAPFQGPDVDIDEVPANVEEGTGEEPAPINATDNAIALAVEHRVDVANVRGSGTDGRITKDDVSAFLEVRAAVAEFPDTDAALLRIGLSKTADEAFPLTVASLERWPENEGLLDTKRRLDEIFASRS